MERAVSEVEVLRARSAYNAQLEDRVNGLELKLKRAEEENIECLEREKNLKRENSMLSFSANKGAERNRIRDLEGELAQEKAKLDMQRKLTAELQSQTQKHVTEIKVLRDNELTTAKKWEMKMEQMEVTRQSEELRQSQSAAANEEKIALLSQ
jgi:hypothetical protein